MSKFKVGDRVVVKRCYDNDDIIGKSATIIEDEHRISNHEVLLYFDEPHPTLHRGLMADDKYKNRCWWIENNDKNLKKEEIDVITIKRSGNTLIAFDNVNHKKAIAKCSPEDEFDLETGVNIVINRLFKGNTRYTGKVVCVDCTNSVYKFTVGRIYDFKDGVMYDDKKQPVGVGLDFFTFNDFAEFINATFIEVVE